jgi:hypothetical protein
MASPVKAFFRATASRTGAPVHGPNARRSLENLTPENKGFEKQGSLDNTCRNRAAVDAGRHQAWRPVDAEPLALAPAAVLNT